MPSHKAGRAAKEKLMAHTPGPWTAEEDSGRAEAEGKDGFFHWLVESDSCTVAGVTGVGGTEAASNALLIAAAPELLDALHSLLIACTEARWPWTADQMLPLIQARAAIAKADGRASEVLAAQEGTR